MAAMAALFVVTLAAPTAFATPGAVNKQGCHGKPKHCHSASAISTNKRGFRYVPFGQG
jgi:hypothetical protein